MNVLRNYKILSTGGYEEYPAIQVGYDELDVYADLPLCAIPYGVKFKAPVLLAVGPRGIASVSERDILVKHLKEKTKIVYFDLDEKKIPHITQEKTELFMRLPLEENAEDYLYDYQGGKIFVIEVAGKAEKNEE
jgi:hypothetical protein